MKKVSILSPNLSGNCMARAYVLARLLRRRYEVNIVGPVLGRGLWEPIAGEKAVEIKPIEASIWPSPYWKIRCVAGLADGDVIYASKPLITSLGIAVRLTRQTGKPLILDIDDWEAGFVMDRVSGMSLPKRLAFMAASALLYYRPGSHWNVLLSEKLIKHADAVTVSNTYLESKYGGTVIRHARDTDELNPDRFDRDALRHRYDVPESAGLVLFLGTPAAYKGIDDLIGAVARTKRANAVLMVIGMDLTKPYCRRIKAVGDRLLGQRFRPLGFQPLARLPEFMTMADVFVIPQRLTPATVGQLPAKLFDAMAMARPVIATAVGDLPDILEGCGWVVSPERPDLLAAAIEEVLGDPARSQCVGEKARRKCVARYSYDAVSDTLLDIVRMYE